MHATYYDGRVPPIDNKGAMVTREPVRATARRSTKVPQVRDQILGLIQERHLRPGDRVPTEPELASLLEVSRSTVREALKAMEQDGVLNAVQGSGRYLSGLGALQVERPITIYESMTDMLQRLGFDVTTVVLSVDEDHADDDVAAELGIEPGDNVIRLLRLRVDQEAPLVLSLNIIPREYLPGPLEFRDWSASVTSALEGHGHAITSSVARIKAANVPSDLAGNTDLRRYDPWLVVEETCITRDGLRALYAVDYHRSSEIAFSVVRRR